MFNWFLVRETSQFALAGIAACIAAAAFARQVLNDRPKIVGAATRNVILTDDLKAAAFVVIDVRLTNNSRIANGVHAYSLVVGERGAIDPASWGTTADGTRWFLRSRDESVTAYFPVSSPAKIPRSAVDIAPGHSQEFEMPFALSMMPVRDAISVRMEFRVESTRGRRVSIDVPAMTATRLVRSRNDGNHPIELYGSDGSKISFEDAMAWDDFETAAPS